MLPILFSSPDTRWAFGVLPQYLFQASPEGRPSAVRMDAFYTQNKQFNVQLSPQFWLDRDAYKVVGKAVFKEWPTSFYGIGGDTRKVDQEKFTERQVSVSAEVQRRIRPGLFAGVRYTLRWSRIKDVDEGGRLPAGAITGSGSGTASGVGMLVSWDTRDHVYYPTSGSWHQFAVSVFDPVVGSAYRFSTYSLDLRRYAALGGPHVVAVQASLSHARGDPPFRMLAGVGEVLRGYSTMRYIDKNRLAVQAEYRVVPVWWRLGFVVFAGVGDVAGRLVDFDLKDPKYTVGFGLRFVLFTKEKITVRQDFGFGRGSSGDYLDLNEAF